MKQGPSRIRRLATAGAAGAIALSFLSVLGLASPASAIPSGSPVGTTVAASAPTMVQGVVNQAAGNETVTLAPTATGTSAAGAPSCFIGGHPAQLSLSVTDFNEGANVHFDHVPTVTAPSVAGNSAFTICPGGLLTFGTTITGGGTILNIFYTAGAATGAPQPINISDIAYDVLPAAVAGPVVVTGTDIDLGYGPASGQVGNLTPKSTVSKDGGGVNFYDPAASNAVVATTAISQLFADATPVITPGATTAGGPWEDTMNGTGNAWSAGDKIYITVARNDALNCETVGSPDSIGFSAVPTISVKAAAGGATVTPTLTASLASMGSCAAFSGVNNVLVLTFTNSGTITGGTASTGVPGFHTYSADITISGVSYTVSGDVGDPKGPTANLGNIDVLSRYNAPPTFGATAVANDTLGWATPTNLTVAAPAASTTLTVTALPAAIPSGTTVLLGGAGFETVTTTANAAQGATTLNVSATANAHPIGTPVSVQVVLGSTAGATGGPSNANIQTNLVTVSANKPSVTLQANFTSTGASITNAAISPIVITESTPGSLGGGVTGFACVTLAPIAGQTAEFNASTNTPTATLGGGLGSSTIPVTVQTTGTQTGPATLEFQIPTASTSSPGTVTLSGLAVNVVTTKGVIPKLQGLLAYNATNAACSGTVLQSQSNPFTLANMALRTFGQTQDASAAQVFESFPPACAAGVPSATNETPAVLVTNGSYQDALSASYLAGQLHTGILTTPTASVSPDALSALRLDGVTEVFVVGGPLVVSQANVTQLQNTPSFNCGGTSQRTTIDGQPVNLVVQQIFGQTADGTAAAVATFPGTFLPGTAKYQAAYTGQYNDTSGSNGTAQTAAPDLAVTTAVLATDNAFQDAASASAIAYQSHFPLLLTGQASLSPEAATALTNDGVQQVIVPGGPIAVSDNVLTQVEAMGISVLRVAGQDFTDTSQLLAQFELNSVVPAGQPLAGQTNGLDYGPIAKAGAYVVVARGDYYTDAIVASRVAGVFGPVNIPIVLTWDPNNEGNPSGTNYLGTFLHTVGQVTADPGTPSDGTMNNLFFVGGPFAISNALETTIATSLNG